MDTGYIQSSKSYGQVKSPKTFEKLILIVKGKIGKWGNWIKLKLKLNNFPENAF